MGPGTLFPLGSPVRVRWMDEDVEATIYMVGKRRYHGTVPRERRYRVSIEGVEGHPWYAEHEIEATAACCVCGQPGTSRHSEPGGDTFWLCDEHLAECDEVAREGQYVTPEEAENGN